MKPFLIFLFGSFLLLPGGGFGQEKPASTLKAMTFNIRYDNPADGINSWISRRSLVASTILSESPDIIGFQEVLKNQLDYLDSILEVYACYGVGREDGKDKGEYCPVFYREDRFLLIDAGTIWLSSNPADTGSTGWDAVLPRILTWAKLTDRQSGKPLYFLNTHFDHQGETARLESARLIRRHIAGLPGEHTVILTGDFNCDSMEAPYQELTRDDTPPFLTDAAAGKKVTGHIAAGTFNGFGASSKEEPIDFIFIDEHFTVDGYEVLQVKDGERYISDHYPVLVNLIFVN